MIILKICVRVMVEIRAALHIKALNENSWIFAHPSTLNNSKPTGFGDLTLSVCDGTTPYGAIPKGFFGFMEGVKRTSTLN